MTTWCHIPCMSWACCTNRKATLRRPLPLLKMPSKCFHPIQSPYSYSWFHVMKCLLLDDVLPQNQIINSKGPDKNDYPRAKFGSNFNEHVQCCVVRYSKAPCFKKVTKRMGLILWEICVFARSVPLLPAFKLKNTLNSTSLRFYVLPLMESNYCIKPISPLGGSLKGR